jgi:hypothetical protein
MGVRLHHLLNNIFKQQIFVVPDTVLGVGDTMMMKQTCSLPRWKMDFNNEKDKGWKHGSSGRTPA